MKVLGWALVVFSSFGLFVSISNGLLEMVGTAILWLAVGAYLIHRSKQKEKEKEDLESWNK